MADTQRKYIGARYVPLIMGEWDSSETYEPLSVVLHEGNSYTSRTFVPAGIPIDNDVYWALSGTMNAGVADERAERIAADTQLQTNIDNESLARQNADNNLQTQINAKLDKPDLTGANGQILTYQDGATEWSNVGTPTDAQVESAVSDWLDDHPEATTTVQDGSITDAKLVQSGGILSNALQYKGWLNSTQNVETLDPGIYIIPASGKPSGLPSGYPASALGVFVTFYTMSSNGMLSIASAAYEKRLWVRTTYGWSELPKTSDLSDYFKFQGVMPANTNIRTAAVGSYALYPTSQNPITGLPEDYDGTQYGHVIIMHSSATAPYIILTQSDGKTWVTMAAGSWFRLFPTNTLDSVKISVIGDSITEHNFRANKCWVDLMTDSGFNMQNLGASGTGFANPGVGEVNRYIDRISSIAGDTGLIGISSSFNDVALTIPVGNVSDTGTSSICGYINDFFDALITAFPTTPICCYTLNAWGDAHYGQNDKATDYVEKFDEICKLRGFPFLSLYTSSGMYPWIPANAEYYFTPPTGTADTVHPNDEGHKLLFRKLLPHFMSCAKLSTDFYINQKSLNA